MQSQDNLQRFLFEHAEIRGELVHLNQSYQAILQQHPYPDAIKHLLGEALVASVLLSGSIQFKGDVCVQFQGDERLPLLIAQCTDQLELRGFAKYRADELDLGYQNAFLNGKMVLNINQTDATQSYQSIVPIQSAAMSENLMHYFAQSEQLSTHIWIAINQDGAAGFLLQAMPNLAPNAREEFWDYATHIGQTLTDHELLHLDNPTLLHRLYHETELRLFDPRPVKFSCRCSNQAMQRVLATIGQQELRSILEERDTVDITCDFCNKTYKFDAIDVEVLFRKQ